MKYCLCRLGKLICHNRWGRAVRRIPLPFATPVAISPQLVRVVPLSENSGCHGSAFSISVAPPAILRSAFGLVSLPPLRTLLPKLRGLVTRFSFQAASSHCRSLSHECRRKMARGGGEVQPPQPRPVLPPSVTTMAFACFAVSGSNVHPPPWSF